MLFRSIDVDNFGAVLNFGLHRPAKRYRMVFRHIRAHDDDAIGVRHAARIHGRGAATEPSPQTGDARAVSYTGLVLDRYDTEPTHELLLDMVPFDIEGGAAE